MGNASAPAIPAMKGLSNELITELMSKTRTRNAYGPRLVDFCENSDEAAINPAEVWPMEFGNKNVATLYQGFRLAAEKVGLLFSAEAPNAPLLIKKHGEQVFILHKDRVEVLLNADTDAE